MMNDKLHSRSMYVFPILLQIWQIAEQLKCDLLLQFFLHDPTTNFNRKFQKPKLALLHRMHKIHFAQYAILCQAFESGLHETEEQKLLHVLRYNKEALGRAFMTQRIWTPQFATTESTLKRSFHPNAKPFVRLFLSVSWSYLPRNSFKFNTDVSSFGNPGRSGFGGVICDFLANWVVGYSSYYGFIMNMATELHAIWYSVKLDFNSSLSHFVCELDSSSGLGLLYEGCIPTHPQAALILIVEDFMRTGMHYEERKKNEFKGTYGKCRVVITRLRALFLVSAGDSHATLGILDLSGAASMNQIMSPVSPPSFYIDAIGTKWEHEDTVHIDHFFGFLIFRCMPNVPGDRIHIIDFCFSWTPPMSSYYRFATLVPKVVIPFKSLSSFVDFVL
ncbi:hypothetical protein JHK82_053063 [Glycine max]|nr:hypothetical protein JHK82_053063 [Glycine max]